VREDPNKYILEYAGFWIRMAAGLVDLTTILLLYFIISSFILWLLAGGAGLFSGISDPFTGYMGWGSKYVARSLFSMPVAWTMGWLMSLMYFCWFWVWRGQTFGKMVMGIKVIRTDSSEISWLCAIIRFFGGLLSIAILFIGYIWIHFDEKKQGLHDKLADTIVVKLPVRQLSVEKRFVEGSANA
jgi:uncharacterized RDD family membrane protein YckC